MTAEIIDLAKKKRERASRPDGAGRPQSAPEELVVMPGVDFEMLRDVLEDHRAKKAAKRGGDDA
ncbi:MAG: hypothetical protein NW203_10185 [Hyphomonadaceae bacterium]|nr:hypothetical protein [Hyphomonadaceae bacterium]